VVARSCAPFVLFIKMATIVISSTGTLGDHLPYVALGAALQQRGHRVRMALRPSMLGYAREWGLETYECGMELTEETARSHAVDWDEWQAPHVPAAQQMDLMQQRILNETPVILNALEAACVDADVLICGFQRHLFGALLAQKIKLPWMAASVTPVFQCVEPSLQQVQNTRVLRNRFAPVLNTLCEQNGIVPPTNWLEAEKNPRSLLGASAYFAQTAPSYAHYQACGFWFYASPAWQQWQPDEALRRFMEAGDPPLYLSFSSIPVVNPRHVLALHVRAAAQLGLRLVVQRGCADFHADLLPDDCDPDQVQFVDFLPQDWLLPRTAAIIHHGGVGTLARALRHDCPMLIEPLGNDQFFNAARILKLQVGAAVHPHKITADSLARVLENKVLNEQTRQHTRALGEKIRAEDGATIACQWIESWLSRS
jgi:UDP:flavonoid glycosyltransferase YjiC (YdhE family)